jgi:hypothetical protein
MQKSEDEKQKTRKCKDQSPKGKIEEVVPRGLHSFDI